MQRHLKPLLLSLFLFTALYWAISHYQLSLNDAEAKQPGGGELSALGVGSKNQGPYDLASGRVLSKVIESVSSNYIDPARIKPRDMFLASLEYLSKSVAEIMVEPPKDDKDMKVSVLVDKTQKTFSLDQLDNLYELRVAMKEVFAFLEANLSKETELRNVEYTAINGLLSVLDPHTILLKPDLFADMKAGTKGEFGGLGIQIGIRDGMLTVIAPIDGTPASRAGLKAQDKIVKIDDESTINMDLNEAVDRLRGAPGTEVNIAVTRKGWSEPQDFPITRAIIKIESVTYEVLSGGIGYIQIKNFQGNTFDDLQDALSALRRKGANKGLVLDLRDNPGGLLDQAIKISDAFLKKGMIVSTVGMSSGRQLREDRPATEDGSEYTLPLAVLVNGGSASASEIVSGAIKNNDRGVIIGRQTFGKGSVQVLYDFSDGSALKLTIAQYLTPGDVSIQGVGVTPDIMLLPSTVSKERVTYFTSESLTKEADLDAHLSSAAAVTALEPEEKIHYFVDPKEEEKARKLLEEDVNAFWEDPEILFAKEFLLSASGNDREDLLASGESFFSKYSSDQEAEIASALTSLGIDWAQGKSITMAGQGVAEIAFGGKDHNLTAGEESELTLTVKNTGPRPLYRVRAQTKSDNPLFDDLELFVGQIPVGESRSYELPVKIPKDAISRSDKVSFTLFEDGGSAPPAIEENIQIKGLERPVFAYGYRILDEEGGNGDGLLQVGETVKFVLTVKNNGKGRSFETLAALKNHAGKSILLKDGRTYISDIAPGDQKTAVFTFDVRAKPERGEAYLLEISIADTTLREYVTEKLPFPLVESAAPVTPETVGLTITKEDAPLFGGADSSTSVIASLARNSQVFAKARVGDFYKVHLADGTLGFVKADDTKAGDIEVEKARVKLSLQNSPPLVSVDVNSGTTTRAAYLKLGGVVTDDSKIRDVYILVNGKKLFYQSNSGAKDKLKFTSNLPLEVGSNQILVIARETEDVVSRELIVIRRKK